jgi:hypothetical protein
MDAEIDDIEELKRWIAVGLQNAAKADAERLKLYIDLMLVGAEQFTGILQSKCAALAKQCRPRKVKPPKPVPQSGPQKQSDKQSNTDTPDSQNDSEGRSQGQSRIMQGVQQADTSRADQQQQIRRQTYGAQNKDVAFNKTAKAIAS